MMLPALLACTTESKRWLRNQNLVKFYMVLNQVYYFWSLKDNDFVYVSRSHWKKITNNI